MTATSTLICFISTLCVFLRPLRMFAAETPVKLECGANQSQMRERLRKVSERLPADGDLFRIKPNVIRVGQHFFEHEPAFIHAARASERLCIPERARAEAAFLAGKA